MTPSALLVGELCISRPCWIAHHPAQRFPFRLRADRDRDPLVIAGASISIVRRHNVVAITLLAAIAAIHEVVHVPFGHLADDGLAHARIDPLPFAGATP